jgi:hypothetical protein
MAKQPLSTFSAVYRFKSASRRVACQLTMSKVSKEEAVRRSRRKGSYHTVASRNKLPHPDDPEEEEGDMLLQFLTASSPNNKVSPDRQKVVQQAKSDLLQDLAASRGDTTTPGFKKALDQLAKLYDPETFDARKEPPPPIASGKKNKSVEASPQLEGMWLTLSTPRFQDCLGFNEERHLQYSLGRMSFDMFKPGPLVCSIQGTFNPVHVLDKASVQEIKNVPKTMVKEVKAGDIVVRSYE